MKADYSEPLPGWFEEFEEKTLQTIEEEALSNLPSLKKLDLRCRQSKADFIFKHEYIFSRQLLKELPKNFVSQVPNLTEIDLSYNTLAFLDDESFSGLGGLTHLDLSHNQV